ncbi:hypothetical protein C7974DRAFT_404704 [Boeremia exigua]|uniref:uncharacterized protein n=1 Tax=Boeremia exigua TaxID=749465 RepID=UPI001E8CA305|nr:uncharacterized protein C7974DRAFT_404704 [Boeremia exigua]KAH6614212.1 hypothetical protein C7974DRAFT_404704 [Boeremia exigua]
MAAVPIRNAVEQVSRSLIALAYVLAVFLLLSLVWWSNLHLARVCLMADVGCWFEPSSRQGHSCVPDLHTAYEQYFLRRMRWGLARRSGECSLFKPYRDFSSRGFTL